MENLTDKQIAYLTEQSGLTPYHWQRREAAHREAEEMSKRPYSYEEKLEQTARNKAIRENDRKIKASQETLF